MSRYAGWCLIGACCLLLSSLVAGHGFWEAVRITDLGPGIDAVQPAPAFAPAAAPEPTLAPPAAANEVYVNVEAKSPGLKVTLEDPPSPP